jgi:glucosamine-6-phosphate deaminase
VDVRVLPAGEELARAVATDAATAVNDALERRNPARVMFASGNSQLGFLAALHDERVDWSRVVGFHMDEYIGVDAAHPASFARYMRERVADALGVGRFHYLDGAAPDPEVEARRYAALLADHPLDLCCLGVGENGHLAFNDPPVADFDDPLDVKVVELDEASRRQQVGEGHFPSVDAVPPTAITVTIPALLRARRVLAVVPEARKAEPARRALEDPVSTECPASILRTQPHVTMYLDYESSARLRSSA